jgi:adenylate cyclase class 2
MPFLNIEIKAKAENPASIRQYLLANNAGFTGTDFQTDTYFHVKKGRLKLREGNIENNLIYYERTNQPGPKSSLFHLFAIDNPAALKKALALLLGIKFVVKKEREIYYIGHVKFHIDRVDGLGSFMEIEAGNILADRTREELEAQCNFYMKELGIKQDDLLKYSYCDMLMNKGSFTGQ